MWWKGNISFSSDGLGCGEVSTFNKLLLYIALSSSSQSRLEKWINFRLRLFISKPLEWTISLSALRLLPVVVPISFNSSEWIFRCLTKIYPRKGLNKHIKSLKFLLKITNFFSSPSSSHISSNDVVSFPRTDYMNYD
jgi:hypothetical protein